MVANEGSSLLKNADYGSTTAAASGAQEEKRVQTHTQSTFMDDLINFREGSVPHSIVLATMIGVACGIAAYLYYACLWFLLEVVWHTWSEKFVVGVWPEWAYPLYIPLVGFSCAILVGLSVKYLGDPGDLNYVVKCVHEKAFIAVDHTLPMICASQFSIIGGGSLGPEAPLVAICAAISGFISRLTFKQRNRNIVRKHTLFGMAGALAAFFGCPLGGALFSLEITSRMGMEYFEHAIESIFCGEITLAVFRGLSGLPIAPIWKITDNILLDARPYEVFLGILIGLFGATLAWVFKHFHGHVMELYRKLGWLSDENAVQRALLGSIFIILLGMVFPQTMFWGEYEFQTIGTLSPASTLEHIWPTTGLIGWEMDSGWKCFVTGLGKLIAISWTVAGGYRGGFIFPFFAAGACFGRAICFVFPIVPVQLACLGMAAAINVSITRTSLATTLILCYLSGEQSALSGVMASSLTALFATAYWPFLRAQVPRADMREALFYNTDAPEIISDDVHLTTHHDHSHANNGNPVV